ncbi:MAG: S-layer homology domain-containing protein [Clostridiaceae bacterium]|nr:S-layer homology domain-containing protein [Clostridiaceae bacterium]
MGEIDKEAQTKLKALIKEVQIKMKYTAPNISMVAQYSSLKSISTPEGQATLQAFNSGIESYGYRADYSIAGAPTFSDQDKISTWALEHVKYMSKLEIIKGTDGKFMPKAVTSAEIASGYANTTREQAIAMSLRTFNKFGK